MAAVLKVVPSSLSDNGEVDVAAGPSGAELRQELEREFRELVRWVMHGDDNLECSFKTFELALVPRVFLFARLLVMLFLCCRNERSSAKLPEQLEVGDRSFERRKDQARNLSTTFGAVRYWRTYYRASEQDDNRQGFYPLDAELGLNADRLSMPLMSVASRLATKLSFETGREVLSWFVPGAPSTEVIEKTVLGFGRHAEPFFELLAAPEGDGEVLVVLVDGKAAPSATETELKRRRGKRRRKPRAASPRHRGRAKRQRYGSKPRRKKGDKSKNGKVANVVVMYTLRRSKDGKQLLGPINKRLYASFGPKRHAFAFARREADKRGFAVDSGKRVQVLTDGDNDYAEYIKEYFPGAIHTIDVMHVVERLWSAGQCLYREGSDELNAWVERQKHRLYGGHERDIVAELEQRLDAIPRTGPGNKGKRERLTEIIRYLDKRLDKMNYAELLLQDLELSTGAVEGAVKYVVGLRFDHGGMRWIKERAEALLKLRCIELNGDWDSFIDYVHDKLQHRAFAQGERIRLQTNTPEPLPNLAAKAA